MKNIILFCSLILVALSSCNSDKPKSANLGVTTEKESYNVGDTVTFKFHGAPDNIVFYSGEYGHNYDLKDMAYTDNDLLIDFSTWVRYGDIYQNLQCMVCNDFKEQYDKEGIDAATWSDITDKFTFSTGVDNTPSGVVSLKSYAGEDDNTRIYIAFRYTDTEKPRQNNWIVRSINVDRVSPEGVPVNLATMANMGWSAVDLLNPDKKWAISATQVLIDGGVDQAANEDWIISKGFKIKEASANSGVALKNISTTMDQFSYIYTTAGTYKAVFATSSVWHSGEKYSLTEVEIVIE